MITPLLRALRLPTQELGVVCAALAMPARQLLMRSPGCLGPDACAALRANWPMRWAVASPTTPERSSSTSQRTLSTSQATSDASCTSPFTSTSGLSPRQNSASMQPVATPPRTTAAPSSSV